MPMFVPRPVQVRAVRVGLNSPGGSFSRADTTEVGQWFVGEKGNGGILEPDCSECQTKIKKGDS